MFQYEYNLCAVKYDENNNIYYEKIKLSDLSMLKNDVEFNTLKSIDWFTSCFENYTQLYQFLEREGLIDGDASNFVITMDQCSVNKEGKNKKFLQNKLPTCAQKILYRSDRNKLSMEYIKSWIEDSNNYRNLIELMNWYSNTIKVEKSRTKKIYENLKKSTIVLMNSDLLDEGYILFDKFRGDVDRFLDTLKKDSKNENYRKMRDFITLISYIDNGVIKLPEITINDEIIPTFEPDEIRLKYSSSEHEEFIMIKEDEKSRKQATRRM